jgi:hypothetical protein
MNEFEINGTKYSKQNAQKSRRLPPMLMGMMMMVEMAYAPNIEERKTRKENQPKINIIEEYGLIQQKNSKLSRSQREWVTKTFERNFIVVPTGEEKSPPIANHDRALPKSGVV